MRTYCKTFLCNAFELRRRYYTAGIWETERIAHQVTPNVDDSSRVQHSCDCSYTEETRMINPTTAEVRFRDYSPTCPALASFYRQTRTATDDQPPPHPLRNYAAFTELSSTIQARPTPVSCHLRLVFSVCYPIMGSFRAMSQATGRRKVGSMPRTISVHRVHVRPFLVISRASR